MFFPRWATLCRKQLALDHGNLTFLRRVLLNLFPWGLIVEASCPQWDFCISPGLHEGAARSLKRPAVQDTCAKEQCST